MFNLVVGDGGHWQRSDWQLHLHCVCWVVLQY